MVQQSPSQDVGESIKKQLFTIYGKPKYNIIDKYSVYQSFAECWIDIESDLSRICSEGREICKETEPLLVMKKDSKTKKFIEEQIGIKGKIFSLDLIEKTYFKDDFSAINFLATEAETSLAEYTDIWENMDEDIIAELSKEGDDNTEAIQKQVHARAMGTTSVAAIYPRTLDSITY